MKHETHLDTPDYGIIYEVPENRNATVLLLTIGGQLVRGQWYGEHGEHFLGYFRMPKRDRAREAEILAAFNRNKNHVQD